MVPPRRIGLTEVLEGACRFATYGFRQAVWNQTAPGNACYTPGNFGCKARSHGGFYTALDEVLEAMFYWAQL